jgi:MYXO-CTERM domain-containing protein
MGWAGRRGARAVASCVALLVAGACASTRDEAPVPASVPPPSPLAPPSSLAELVARRSFEHEGDAWVAGTTRVTGDGVVRFAPSLDRGAAALELRAPTPARSVRVASDGALVIDRGGLEETLRQTGPTLEQSWTFATRPAAPPVLRVSARGMRYSSTTSSGHHFVDDTSGLGVRYSNATWIDARGARTAVPVTREGEELVLRVPPAAAEGPYPAVLDPTLSPELGTDAPIPTVGGSVQSIASAPGPSGTFFMAWVEQGDYAVRTARLTADGQVIGKVNVLSYAGGVGVACAFDSVAQRWLVASATGTVVRLTRIAADGTVLDPVPKTIAGANLAVDVAFDGAAFLVAYSSYAAMTSSVHALRVNSATAAFDPASAIAVSASVGNELRVACGAALTGCAVLWSTNIGDVRLSRISNAGALLDASGISLAANGQPAALASDGTQWLSTWIESGSPQKLRGARVSAGGVVQATADLDASTSGLSPGPATWDGTSFVATWKAGYYPSTQIYARRVAPDGTLVDGVRVAIAASGAQEAVAVAASGTRSLFSWGTYNVSGPVTLSVRPFSSALAPVGAALTLTLRGNDQASPVAGFNGSTYLAAWTDSRSPTGSYAARLTSAGVPIDSVAQRLFDTTTKITAIASDGSDFLVVGRNGDKVVAARVGKSATALVDSPPIVVASKAVYADANVAYDGANYVVTWTSQINLPFTAYDVYAARITPQGALLDPAGFAVSAANGNQLDSSIASDGNISFVAWTDYRTDYYSGDLWGSRVSRAGASLDPQGILIAKRPQAQVFPSVAAGNGEFTVAWQDNGRTGGNAYDLLAARVSTGGVLLDAAPVSVFEGDVTARPKLVDMRDGFSKLVAWEERRADGRSVVSGAWLRGGAKLEVLDKPPVQLSADPGASFAPSFAPAAVGSVALLYQRFEPDGAARAHLRFVSSGKSTGEACTATTDCRSRYCKDALCCAEACEGACRRCSGAGVCDAVRSADDPDTCTGENTCDANGACRKKSGSVCALASDCASGFCVDSICCNVACDGACDTCTETRGTCTPLPRGSLGTPSCSPNRCDGKAGTCATGCLTDDECADGFGCDRPTKTCVAGTVCIDIRTTRETNGAIQGCAPYACRSGHCAETCKNTLDCAFPAACDEAGRCIASPDATTAACSASPGERGSSEGAALLALGVVVLARRRRNR